jgi:predicted component of type VI protein secretion system
VEDPDIDLQQRLSAGLKSGAEHIALAAPPASVIPKIEADREGITAYLLLESAMGTRRVQLGEKPVSIGTSPACDLALPEQEGIEPEHVLVWQHGTRIVLHSDLNATCLVNENPVTWAMLEDGDRLQVGTYTLRVSMDAAA